MTDVPANSAQALIAPPTTEARWRLIARDGRQRRRAVLASDRPRRLAIHHHGAPPGLSARMVAVIGAEFLAAFDWGLGWVIFDARELLNTDVVLASLLVIGAIGFIFERLVFGSLERATVLRWVWCV